MKKWLIVGIILGSVLTSISQATSTISGPSGLISVPTAEALKYKEFNVSVDYNYSSLSEDNDEWFYKVNVGTFRSWELGVVGGRVPTEGVFVNAKYYLMSDNERFPLSLALGFSGLTSLTGSSLYMVTSKSFQGGIHGHLGFRTQFNQEQITPSIMGGAEYFLSNQLSFLGDFDGQDTHYLCNVGVKYTFWEDIYIRGAILDCMNQSSKGMLYSIGISCSKYL